MARRIARTWSGGVLLAGALLLFVCATTGSEHDPAVVILGTWFLAFITYHFALEVRPRPWPPHTLARASLIVPSLGVLALLPLTIHLPFFAFTDSLDTFQEWVALSALFTAPTTITAGILMSVRASKLAEGRTVTGVLSPWGIYLVGLAAAGPFLLLVLPGILIAITGLPFIALMRYQATIVEREHAIAATSELPAAIAQFRAAA